MIIEFQDGFKKDLKDINKKLKVSSEPVINSTIIASTSTVQAIWDEDNNLLMVSIDFSKYKGDINSINEIVINYEALYDGSGITEAFKLIPTKGELSSQKNIFHINLQNAIGNNSAILAEIKPTIINKDIEFLEKRGLDIGYSVFLLDDNNNNKLITKDSFDKYLYKQNNNNSVVKYQYGKNFLNHLGESISRNIIYRNYNKDEFFPKFIGNINTEDNTISIGYDGGLIKLSGFIGFTEYTVENNKVLSINTGQQKLKEFKSSLITDVTSYQSDDDILEIDNNTIRIPKSNNSLSEKKYIIKVEASFINYDNSVVNCVKEFTIVRLRSSNLDNSPWILNFSKNNGEDIFSDFFTEIDSQDNIPVLVFRNRFSDSLYYDSESDNNAVLEIIARDSKIGELISNGKFKIKYDFLDSKYGVDFINPENIFNTFFNIDLDNISQVGNTFSIPIKKYPEVSDTEDSISLNLSNLTIPIELIDVTNGGSICYEIDTNDWLPQLQYQKNAESDLTKHKIIVKATISFDLGEENGGIFSTSFIVVNEPIMVTYTNLSLKFVDEGVINRGEIQHIGLANNDKDIMSEDSSYSGKSTCSIAFGFPTDNDTSYWYIKNSKNNITGKNNLGEFRLGSVNTPYSDYRISTETISCYYTDYMVNDTNLSYPDYYDFPDTTSVTIGILKKSIFDPNNKYPTAAQLINSIGNSIDDWKNQILMPKFEFDFQIKQTTPSIQLKSLETIPIHKNILLPQENIGYIIGSSYFNIKSVNPVKVSNIGNFSNIPPSKDITFSGKKKIYYQMDVYDPKVSNEGNYLMGSIVYVKYFNEDLKNYTTVDLNIQYTQNKLLNSDKLLYILDNGVNYSNKDFYYEINHNSYSKDELGNTIYPIKSINVIDDKNIINIDKENNIALINTINRDVNYETQVVSNYLLECSNNNSEFSISPSLSITIDDDGIKTSLTNLTLTSKKSVDLDEIRKFPLSLGNDTVKSLNLHGYNTDLTSQVNILHCPIPPVLRDSLGNFLKDTTDVIIIPNGEYNYKSLFNINEDINDQVIELGSDYVNYIISPYPIGSGNSKGWFNNTTIKGIDSSLISSARFLSSNSYPVDSNNHKNSSDQVIQLDKFPRIDDEDNLGFLDIKNSSINREKVISEFDVNYKIGTGNIISGVTVSYIDKYKYDYNTKYRYHFIKNIKYEFFKYLGKEYYSGDKILIEDLDIYEEKLSNIIRINKPITYVKCNRSNINSLEISENCDLKIESYINPESLPEITTTKNLIISNDKYYLSSNELQKLSLYGISNIPLCIFIKDINTNNFEIQGNSSSKLDTVRREYDISSLYWRNFNIKIESFLCCNFENNSGYPYEKTIDVCWKGFTRYLEVIENINKKYYPKLYFSSNSTVTKEISYTVEGDVTSINLTLIPKEVSSTGVIENAQIKDNVFIYPDDDCAFDIKEAINPNDINNTTLYFPRNISNTNKTYKFIVKFDNLEYTITVIQKKLKDLNLYINSEGEYISLLNNESEFNSNIDQKMPIIPIHSSGNCFFIGNLEGEDEEERRIFKYQNFGYILLKSNHDISENGNIKVEGYYTILGEGNLVTSVYINDLNIISSVHEKIYNENDGFWYLTVKLELPPNCIVNKVGDLEKPLEGFLTISWGSYKKYLKFYQGYITLNLLFNNIEYKPIMNIVPYDDKYYLSNFNNNIGTENDPIKIDLNNDAEGSISAYQREVELKEGGLSIGFTGVVLSILSHNDEPYNKTQYAVSYYYNDPWTIWLPDSEGRPTIPASYVIRSTFNTDMVYKNDIDYPKIVHSCDIEPLYENKDFIINVNTIISLNRIKKYPYDTSSTDNINNYITNSSINAKLYSPFNYSFWLQNNKT